LIKVLEIQECESLRTILNKWLIFVSSPDKKISRWTQKPLEKAKGHQAKPKERGEEIDATTGLPSFRFVLKRPEE